MNKRTEKALEAFLIITFPVALFAGCAGNGDNKDGKTQASLLTGSDQTEIVSQESMTGEPIMESHVLEQDKELGVTVETSSAEIGAAPRYYGGFFNAPGQHVFGFASNQHTLTVEDKEVLKQHALFLIENPSLILTVAGHADNKGSAEYNKKLSEKRAQEVVNTLVSYGVTENRLIVDSYGETVPLNNEERLQENRRVELQYNSEVVVSSSL